jgi:Domain of unknown function (DUF4388)
MPLKSSFSDFSVAECFRLIDQGRKTGRLSISYLEVNSDQKAKQYFWFREGQFIATSNTLDGTNLASEIVRRNWMSQRVVEKLINLSKEGRPLGLNLKLMGALRSEQIASLFGFQLKQLLPILETSEGEYQLDSQIPFPYSEMTGLSIRAIEVAVETLRQVRHWKALEEMLPKSSSAIQRWNMGEQTLRLTQIEMKILDYADGRKSLTQISRLLGYEMNVTLHVAFRLMIANLVDEVPPLPGYAIVSDHSTSESIEQPQFSKSPADLDSSYSLSLSPSTTSAMPDSNLNEDSHQNLYVKNTSNQKPANQKPTTSFLRGIVDFLRSKI